jgi:hypothetical protein
VASLPNIVIIKGAPVDLHASARVAALHRWMATMREENAAVLVFGHRIVIRVHPLSAASYSDPNSDTST